MDANHVTDQMGRRLRLAVIGGGPGSFIGSMHRAAARIDDRYQLVAGAVSSESERSITVGIALGIDPRRSYGSGMELLEAESQRDDGADVVAIMTPNDSHHIFSVTALDAGFDVICDKPMANTVTEGMDVLDRVRSTGLIYCLTHNYTGYPMVRQARAMVEAGMVGDVWLVQVEYVQGGKAVGGGPKPGEAASWRYDPVKGGPSLVLGDIGTHAHNLVRYIAGVEVSEVAADVGAIVPGHLADDYGGAMLRFENGARGTFWVTQAAAGVENCLRIRVSGSKGSLEWEQERPTQLLFTPLGAPAELRTPGGPGTLPLSSRASRVVAGHPEGFHEGFANIYSDAAEAISARRSGSDADPLALTFPNAVDGMWGLNFVDAALRSSRANGAWTACEPVTGA